MAASDITRAIMARVAHYASGAGYKSLEDIPVEKMKAFQTAAKNDVNAFMAKNNYSDMASGDLTPEQQIMARDAVALAKKTTALKAQRDTEAQIQALRNKTVSTDPDIAAAENEGMPPARETSQTSQSAPSPAPIPQAIIDQRNQLAALKNIYDQRSQLADRMASYEQQQAILRQGAENASSDAVTSALATQPTKDAQLAAAYTRNQPPILTTQGVNIDPTQLAMARANAAVEARNASEATEAMKARQLAQAKGTDWDAITSGKTNPPPVYTPPSDSFANIAEKTTLPALALAGGAGAAAYHSSNQPIRWDADYAKPTTSVSEFSNLDSQITPNAPAPSNLPLMARTMPDLTGANMQPINPSSALPTLTNTNYGSLNPTQYEGTGFSTDKAPAAKQDVWANRSNVPTPQTRPTSGPAAASQPGFFSRLFSGDNYQSNNQLVAPKGSKNPTEINWGNNDSNADFFRASQALQKMDPNYVANNADDTFDNGQKRGGAVKQKKEDPIHHALSLISHLVGHKR